jgi:hypothetical protein
MADPLVAIAFGLALGVGLVALSRAASLLVTPDDPARGFVLVALLTMVRMLLVIAALTAYFVLVRAGFLPFALALVSAFIASIGIEAVRTSRSVTPTGPAG